MNMLEEAIVYATIMHQGKVRKFGGRPFILHPMEVAQILSTMTDDMEVIAAGILHDVVEDTDGTLSEIEKRFGERVAQLVNSETEDEYPGENKSDTWQRRKEGSLLRLRKSRDIGVKMLWLADKLANMRSLAQIYSEQGDAMWSGFHGAVERQHWYYKSVAEALELSLNRTGAFKELVQHINFIWPGTFDEALYLALVEARPVAHHSVQMSVQERSEMKARVVYDLAGVVVGLDERVSHGGRDNLQLYFLCAAHCFTTS
jgi:hypothetical protein